MKKAFLLVTILFVSVISTACINNLAVQELNNKAKAYLDKGDYDNAISRLKSSLDLDSSFFETHYNLGIAYTQAEKYPEAVETFEQAVNIKPDFADTYYSLAVARENYAKEIIDGTIKDENKERTEEETIKPEENTSQKKTLSAEEKAKVCELFGKAVQSYQTYIEKDIDIKDKEEAEEKIEYLKIQIEKYSSETPEKAG